MPAAGRLLERSSPLVQDQQGGENREGCHGGQQDTTPANEAQLGETFETGREQSPESERSGEGGGRDTWTSGDEGLAHRLPHPSSPRALLLIAGDEIPAIVDSQLYEHRHEHNG